VEEVVVAVVDSTEVIVEEVVAVVDSVVEVEKGDLVPPEDLKEV
jgi:hypothetical protein